VAQPGAARGSSGEPAASQPAGTEDGPPQPPGDGEESSLPVVTAVFETPLDPVEKPPPIEPPPARAIPPPVADPPQDTLEALGDRRDAVGCLQLDARPIHVEASRGVGPMVEVRVRVSNSCPLAFGSSQTGFRVSASSADGFELGSAVGRFSGVLPPYGRAETAVNVMCDATRAARYRVELH
jgi:hypothetical protein